MIGENIKGRGAYEEKRKRERIKREKKEKYSENWREEYIV